MVIPDIRVESSDSVISDISVEYLNDPLTLGKIRIPLGSELPFLHEITRIRYGNRCACPGTIVCRVIAVVTE